LNTFVCNSLWNTGVGGAIRQSILSAARSANAELGVADVSAAMAYSTAIGMAGLGCSQFVAFIDSRVSRAAPSEGQKLATQQDVRAFNDTGLRRKLLNESRDNSMLAAINTVQARSNDVV
jgi:hypothetical protein